MKTNDRIERRRFLKSTGALSVVTLLAGRMPALPVEKVNKPR